MYLYIYVCECYEFRSTDGNNKHTCTIVKKNNIRGKRAFPDFYLNIPFDYESDSEAFSYEWFKLI